MNHSPDAYHHVRAAAASSKAASVQLQYMEFRAHNAAVLEYKLDMVQHLLQLETKTVPNLLLIQQQPEINLKMRPLLLDFLMDVINKLSLLKLTFPLTVNLIDRYCLIRIVKKQHYQLLGLTSLWIACKNLDLKFKIPLLGDLCKMCCHCYDKKLFLEMENHLLKSLNWLVGAPTFDAYIDFYINLQNAHTSDYHRLNDTKLLAIYICELVQFYPNIYFNYTTSQTALLAFCVAQLILRGTDFLVSRYFKQLAGALGPDQKEVLSVSGFHHALSLVAKVLKCPPPSLKLKYFADDSKFIHLMKLLISFANRHLQAQEEKDRTATPKFYPPTPSSSNISPKATAASRRLLMLDLTPYQKSANEVLPSPKLLPPDNATKTYFSGAAPQPTKKRSIEELHGQVALQPDTLKRSKSVSRPVFFIS